MIIVFYFCTIFILIKGTWIDDCKNTPFWKLNLCEIDCDKCGANGLCEMCPDGFNLTQSTCQQDSDLIYHNTYFTAAEINSTAIDQKMFKASNQYFTMNNIVRFCQSNSYKFDMIGLFNQQTIVTYNINFDTPVTEVKIRFNFFTLYNNTKLQLVLNGDQIYQVVFTDSNLNNTYNQSSVSSTVGYINIPSLTESSVNVIINAVQTDSISFSSSLFNQNNQLNLQIAYTANITNTSSFWAFSDFSVVGKKCQDCLPQKLKTFSNNVGIAIGITSGALIILILIMYLCVKIEEKRRLNSSQESQNYDNFSEEEQKQDEKEEQKQNDLKIRDTINKSQQPNKSPKKNKLS